MRLRNIIIVCLVASLIFTLTILILTTNELNTLRREYNNLLNNYYSLNMSYDLLRSKFSKLESSYNTLVSEHSVLADKYARLELNYKSLSLSYELLNRDYLSLRNTYISLQNKYNHVVEGYEDWRNYFLSYIYFKESIGRVLSSNEISKLTPLVRTIVSSTRDIWRSEWELYNYVKRNVEYVYDPPILYPPAIRELEGGLYVKTTINSIILSPSETLSLKQGDCEDQAILLYAMIKSYEKYMYGKEYTLWLLEIRFNDDSGHVSVAFPVEGGKLTILDPAGSYYTGYPYSLGSNDPYIELKKYSDWFLNNKGIKTITIYNVVDGKIYEVTSGTIYDVAYHIKTS